MAVVHRPKYDDWTLPKGKLDPGESFEDAAVREVEEETGLSCRLGRELDSARYHDARGRPKLVRWWLMEVVEDRGFEPSREVDELRWVPVERVEELLDYEPDRRLVRGLPREGRGG